MNRMKTLLGALLIAVGMIAAPLALADCHDNPATQQCDPWIQAGFECVQQPQACWVALPGDFAGLNQYHTCWMRQQILSRSCRTFDGCGNFSGAYVEHNVGGNDGLSYYNPQCRG